MSRSIRSAASLMHNALAGPSRLSQPLLVRQMPQKRFIALPAWLTRRQDQSRENRRAPPTSSDLTEEQRTNMPIREVAETEAVEGSEDRPTSIDSGSLFEGIAPSEEDVITDEMGRRRQLPLPEGLKKPPKFKEHWFTSGRHKIAPKKLRLLAKQISGLPVEEAILQMQYSLKGAASWVKPTLVLARQHAINYKGANPLLLKVDEVIVNKDKYGPKQIDIKGRGRFGIKRHPYCRLKFVLRHGKPMEEVVAMRFKKDVNKHARSAFIFPEYQPLRRRVNSGWAW